MTLTKTEIDAFRRLPVSFDEMVQAIYTAGHKKGWGIGYSEGINSIVDINRVKKED